MSLPCLIVITGPTGIGKTALSIELANRFMTSIISADSRQFFREMSIGTAKPTKEEIQNIPHYFIDHLSIHDNYNVGMFEVECIELLEKLFSKNNPLIMVGGSGLYVKAVCDGLDQLPQSNKEIRQYLTELYEKEGVQKLQQLLLEYDPEYYNEVDLNNPQRLMRALEVCMIGKVPYSTLRKKEKKSRSFQCVKIGLNLDREMLYARINKRVDLMMASGLLEEAKKLYPFRHLNPLQTVGYQELFLFMENNISLDEAVELIKKNTRNFAKRQLTWFKKDTSIKWFEPHEEEKITEYIMARMNNTILNDKTD